MRVKKADITPETLPGLRARERMTGWSQTEVLLAWFRAGEDERFPLTDTEERMRARWMAARAHFLNLKKYVDIVAALQEEFDIEVSQARKDVSNMQIVFGDIERVTKDAHRARAIEMSLGAYRLAEKKDDPKGMAAATKTYILAAGLQDDDADAIDLEKLMQQRYYVEALDTEVRRLLLQFLDQSGGVVDVSALFERIYQAKGSEAADAEYETMPSAEGEKKPNT